MNIVLSTSNDLEPVSVLMEAIYGKVDVRSTENATRNFILEADMFVFTGGSDVSPGLYGEVELPVSRTNLSRDMSEVVNFMFARGAGKRIFGYCRGHQFINAMQGSKLYQDIPDSHSYIHKINPTSDLIRFDTVNSTHHQGVQLLGHGMKSLANFKDVHEITVSEDGLVMSVQCHPEYENFPSKEGFNNFFRTIFPKV